jgi:DNA-binding beta-propeller fold protein YncE
MNQDLSPNELAESEEEEKRRRRGGLLWWWPGRALRLLLLGLLAILAGMIVTYGIYYYFTRQPIPQLPLAQAVTRGIPPQYLFSIYGVSSPMGVALSPDGERLYVTEGTGDRQVRIFNTTGRQLGVLSPPDSTPSSRAPTYVAVDPTGNIYVSDRIQFVIHSYSADGTYLGVFSPVDLDGEEIVWHPMAIDFNDEGHMYVTDIIEENHRVLIFDEKGTLKSTFGRYGQAAGEFNYPNGIAVDENGRLFVSNTNNGRIDVFSSDDTYEGRHGKGSGAGTVGLPRGMDIDDLERLYVVDTSGHVINVYDIRDEIGFLFSFGMNGVDDGQFLFPNDLTVGRSGRIYVTDRENNRVQVWGY